MHSAPATAAALGSAPATVHASAGCTGMPCSPTGEPHWRASTGEPQWSAAHPSHQHAMGRPCLAAVWHPTPLHLGQGQGQVLHTTTATASGEHCDREAHALHQLAGGASSPTGWPYSHAVDIGHPGAPVASTVTQKAMLALGLGLHQQLSSCRLAKHSICAVPLQLPRTLRLSAHWHAAPVWRPQSCTGLLAM